MENSQPIIKQEETSPQEQSFVSVPGGKAKDNKKREKIFLIIGVAVIIIALGIGGFFFFKHLSKTPDDLESLSDDTDDVEEITLENSDIQAVYQTPEEYVANREKEIESAETPGEKINKELNLASFYIASGELDKAQELLDKFDTSSFGNEENYQYYNILSRLANARGDSELQSEYLSRALDYRTALLKESGVDVDSTSEDEQQ